MDTWNVARLVLDGAFAITLVAVVAMFLYRREKKMRSLIAQYVLNAAEPAGVPSPRELVREPVYEQPRNIRVAPPRPSKPDLVAQYESQRSFAPAPIAARKATRTEKYLEAVRMYRQGSRREDIEKNLGISFMELEMLGQLK